MAQALTASASMGETAGTPTINVTATGTFSVTPIMRVVEASADRTLSADDLYALICFTGSGPQVLTIPAGVMPVGSQVSVARLGEGAVSIAGSGVTLKHELLFLPSLRAQDAILTAVCVSENTVLLVGGLTEVA